MYCVFTDKGDTAAQALGKVTVLMGSGWIAQTSQYSTSPADPAIGDYLTVNAGGELKIAENEGEKIVAQCIRGVVNSEIQIQALSPFSISNK